VSLRGWTSRCVRANHIACTPWFRTIALSLINGIDSERIWFASACSGHGFKHSAAVGEALAQKALGELPTVDFASLRASTIQLTTYV